MAGTQHTDSSTRYVVTVDTWIHILDVVSGLKGTYGADGTQIGGDLYMSRMTVGALILDQTGHDIYDY